MVSNEFRIAYKTQRLLVLGCVTRFACGGCSLKSSGIGACIAELKAWRDTLTDDAWEKMMYGGKKPVIPDRYKKGRK